MARNAVNDMEARFPQLLQPIRDLTENWNIDIAAHLEDYLVEIEKITISFDGGKTTMNFAEAAMLIQGSACVYSKKVEFLYNLVKQMLELLYSKKKLQKQSAEVDEDGNLNPGQEENEDDFLPLDDIEVGRNIDLKEDVNRHITIQFLPRIPVCLLPTKFDSINDDVIKSKKGELIGKFEDFRMNTSVFNPSGMLLLLGCEQDPQSEAAVSGQPTSKQHEISEVQHADGDSICDDAFDPPSPAESMCEDVAGDPAISVHPSAMELRTAMQRHNSPKIAAKREKIKDSEEELKVNVLVPLDPYKEHVKKDKPFKKGTIYKLLPELKRPKDEQHISVRSVAKLESISVYCNEYFLNTSKFPKNPVKIPMSIDCEALYWKEHKSRMRIRKKRKQTKNIPHRSDDEDSEDEYDKENIMPNDSDDDMCPEPLCDDDRCMGEGQLLRNGEENESLLKTSYEELVKGYLENYLSSAKNFQECSELMKKVNEWEQRISPILEEGEKRKAFDIHEYGTKVLDNFENNNRKQTLSFAQIVANKSPAEITRYFASTLQLTNSYNVAISTEGKTAAGADIIFITLLSHKRHHEELQEYVAPSLEHKHK